MSDVFFAELGLPAPDHRLDLGAAVGAGNTAQTARMLATLGPLLGELSADVVLVYGDTNSTLAGGLAAAQLGVPVAHVEAGMRSYDRAMPEELNRVLTDHLATLLLCSSRWRGKTSRTRACTSGVVVVGDVMVDVARLVGPALRAREEILARLQVVAGRATCSPPCTGPATVDDPARLRRVVELLEGVGRTLVLPLHPRTRARLEQAGLLDRVAAAARLCEPLGYLDFGALLARASVVLTDSGGVQKEAYVAGVPCVTLRDRTEWVETVEAGWNTLVGLDVTKLRAALAQPRPEAHPALYGDGHAAERVVAALERLADGAAA